MSRHVATLLADAREEPLAPRDRATVAAHLATCEQCRELERALVRNDAVLALPERPHRLPPLQASVRRPTHSLMRIASVGVSAIVVATAIGVGVTQWRSQHAPETASPSTAAASPGPLALAPAAPSSGFGLVSAQVNELLIRSETSSDARSTFRPAQWTVAVAPNGRSVAAWLGDQNNAWSLHVIDAIDGTTGPALLTTTDESPYGAPRWSTDGTGVIVLTQTAARRGPISRRDPNHVSWFAVDVQTSRVMRLDALEQSVATVAYAWDRQRDLITGGGVVAEGDLRAFVVFHAGNASTFILPAGYMVGAADTYARTVVVVGQTACARPPNAGDSCASFELRDQATFALITTLTETYRENYPRLMFRPRSQDLIVTFIAPDGTVRDELWSDLGRGPHKVLLTSADALDRIGVNDVIPRPDGSAIFILRFDSFRTGRWYGNLISLTDGSRTPFEIVVGGNPIASVVLDPAFASALAP